MFEFFSPPAEIPGMLLRTLVALAFTGAAAYFDIFNKKWVPNCLVYGFLAASLALNVVYFEQVLSHMPAYHLALEKAKGLLNPGGLLVIEEPNDNNPLQLEIAKEKDMYWNVAEHCNYFNFGSMESILSGVGLDVVYKSCTFPMELFYLFGIDYIGDPEVGARVHKMRFNLLSRLNYEQRKEMKESFARMGWGRDIFVIARGVSNVR